MGDQWALNEEATCLQMSCNFVIDKMWNRIFIPEMLNCVIDEIWNNVVIG